jgi:hypothetical protein
MNEDNHFSWLLVAYNVQDGGIMHRYSCKTADEAQKFAKLLKDTAGGVDIIVQKVEHWNLIP